VAGNTPAIAAGGVVNGASFLPGVAPGSWLTITGTNLATLTADWGQTILNGKLPTTLGGVSVTVGSQPAFVAYISPGQINVQAPDVGTGPVPVTVTNANGTSAAFTATVVAQAPAFFLWPNSQAIATRQDGSLAAKDGTFAGATTVAAKPGDVLILWGTGFGPTTPTVSAGIAVPSDQIYNCSPVTIGLGPAPAQVFGCALSPGAAGLYQVAIQVPSTMADGDYAIKATVNGTSSPDGVILSVKK
ncbi:MAG TPA: IPT/TIG domain-containing protein, partial [Candidatus Solibacter sp.]|nr:IPT/TIG domain-containing protein [Candidatus Solibacter sp.]